jgi:hypothetical protein
LVKRPFWQVGYFLNYQLLSISWQNWDWLLRFKNLSQIRYCTCSCRGCHRNATGCCKSNYRCNTNVINEEVSLFQYL